MAYNNLVITVTSHTTADPYVIRAHGKFYLTFTAGDRVEIWMFPNLLDIDTHTSKHVVWRPPPDTDYSADIWAPELHCLDDRWYVYFAGANPAQGNSSHRMYVLGGPPASECPCTSGTWEFLGPLGGLPVTQWAIDGTVMELEQQKYFIYSGWPLKNPNGTNELLQELFIVRMKSPTEIDTSPGPPTRISTPEKKWEWSGKHGINEGPQVLSDPESNWIGIAYSCAGSWTKEYKMATLKHLGGDPLESSSWGKCDKPLLQADTKGRGPWGPGHGSFIALDGQLVGVFHATDGPRDGWNGRKARIQRVQFSHSGPHMGGIVGPLARDAAMFLEDVVPESVAAEHQKLRRPWWKVPFLF